mgnify:CR=1 FL=1
MLYYLFKYLEGLDFPGARMFGYVSFRSLIAIILALLISSIFGQYFITLLKRKQISEEQRDASIDPFNTGKVGVPTIGRHHHHRRHTHPLPAAGEAGQHLHGADAHHHGVAGHTGLPR